MSIRDTIGFLTSLAACGFLWTAAPRADAAELVMVEQDNCSWCARWHAEIGPIYPKTTEHRYAPLRRIDIHESLPVDLAFLKTGPFTPTFILVDEGREIGRIRGYPGEDFFWGLLDGLIKKQKPDFTP